MTEDEMARLTRILDAASVPTEGQYKRVLTLVERVQQLADRDAANAEKASQLRITKQALQTQVDAAREKGFIS